MHTLSIIIDEITKYGLEVLTESENKEEDLEENLVKLYRLYFDIEYVFDSSSAIKFNKKELYPHVIENVKQNFKSFGWYHTLLNLEEIFEEPQCATGDAVDDLSDVIYDLLEVKHRLQYNVNNGLWFFKFIFKAHTQQHILDLLNYLKNK